MLRLFSLFLLGAICASVFAASPMPAINPNSPLYEVEVEPGVSAEDVMTSLKVISEGLNFVNPANFPIGEHMRQRGMAPQGVLETRSFCNLSMGTEIFLDHPEFVVFAPCRIGIYTRAGKLFLALDRPSFDLRYIHQPTARAVKAAEALEKVLLEIMDKARKGEI